MGMPPKKKKEVKVEPIEQTLFKSADKLRKNIDAAEYKHIVLGLIFLKYISDSFETLHQKLIDGVGEYEGADPEDKDEYLAENVFFVPEIARWPHLLSSAKKPEIGVLLDDAMESIEAVNPSLKGILPMVYAKPNLDKNALGELIDLIGNIDLGSESAKSKDLLGKIYEYFLGAFADAEGKRGGQFYTAKTIVQLMVEMIEPYKGRVYDGASGSGGMFVMSEKFVTEHSGRIDDLAIYGQESNQTTWKLCRMNLAIRGINGSQVKWNTEGSFLKDEHKDLKADYILMNPPFNVSDWSGELLQNDPRWLYGTPPVGNANFGWLQHMITHLSPSKGLGAMVLANGSLSSNTGGEGEIRQRMVEDDVIDCILMLPKQLFLNTQIPACIWFVNRAKASDGHRKRDGEVLFIDASQLGEMENRTLRVFSRDNMDKISSAYHNWKKEGSGYEDEKGFCKSSTIEDIAKHKYVLTPGRYVGIPDEIDDGIPFEEKMGGFAKELSEQMAEGQRLDQEIKDALAMVGVEV